MNVGNLLDRIWFTRVILLIWLLSSIFLILLVNRIDSIVHGTLYSYGLQFSNVWAVPFWSFERLIYVCVAIPAILSASSLILDLLGRGRGAVPAVRRVENSQVSRNNADLKNSSMLISCPKCKKVFGKPLTMLDFSRGKAKIVNVCPYCNRRLNGSKENGNEEIGIVDFERKVVKQR